jgi:hypothetical protein
MSMIGDEIYRCQNRGCRCEVKVISSSTECRQNPRCCCGAEMKKSYTPPVFRELTSDRRSSSLTEPMRNKEISARALRTEFQA